MYDMEWIRRMWEQRKQAEAMSAKDVGLGAYNQTPQAPGYGVLQPENLPPQGQQPAGYGVLQQGQLTNTNATAMAADGRTFRDKAADWMGAMSQSGAMGYQPAEGMPGPPGPGRAAQPGPLYMPEVQVREEKRWWLPQSVQRLDEYAANERQRRQRGLLG